MIIATHRRLTGRQHRALTQAATNPDGRLPGLNTRIGRELAALGLVDQACMDVPRAGRLSVHRINQAGRRALTEGRQP